jgi:hypothetical protein
MSLAIKEHSERIDVIKVICIVICVMGLPLAWTLFRRYRSFSYFVMLILGAAAARFVYVSSI